MDKVSKIGCPGQHTVHVPKGPHIVAQEARGAQQHLTRSPPSRRPFLGGGMFMNPTLGGECPI